MNSLVYDDMAWDVIVVMYAYVIVRGYTKVAVGVAYGVHALEAGSQTGFPGYHAVALE